MEIIPKETPKIPPWIDILFYVSVGLLIFVFISIFLISQAMNAAEKTSLELDNKITSENSKSAALKKEILTYKKKINDFSGVINGHMETSNVFGFIESLCHPRVWFTNFDLGARDGAVRLTGEAQSFQDLGQQMIIFKKESLIKKTNLGSVSMQKGGRVGFEISLTLDPSVFVFK